MNEAHRNELSGAGEAEGNLTNLLYTRLKHGDMIQRIVQSLHEPWMDDADKIELEKMILAAYGNEMDDAIDVGIANGHSADAQEKLVMRLFTGI